MKISTRNTFKGKVKQIVPGAVNMEVTLEVAPGLDVTAIIPKSSAQDLDIFEGQIAYALIKSSDVLLAVD